VRELLKSWGVFGRQVVVNWLTLSQMFVSVLCSESLRRVKVASHRVWTMGCCYVLPISIFNKPIAERTLLAIQIACVFKVGTQVFG
jgi:hypothetical protein